MFKSWRIIKWIHSLTKCYYHIIYVSPQDMEYYKAFWILMCFISNLIYLLAESGHVGTFIDILHAEYLCLYICPSLLKYTLYYICVCHLLHYITHPYAFGTPTRDWCRPPRHIPGPFIQHYSHIWCLTTARITSLWDSEIGFAVAYMQLY